MNNRIIKFRAWCLDYKLMDYDFYVSSSGVVFASASRTFDTPNVEIEENPNLLLMQFTGLKDIRGVGIYEGDIVWRKKQGARKVIYPMSETTACFGLVSKSGMRNTLQDASNLYIIIGNIHESPELLERSK